jgi:hypothetical protein
MSVVEGRKKPEGQRVRESFQLSVVSSQLALNPGPYGGAQNVRDVGMEGKNRAKLAISLRSKSVLRCYTDGN